MHANKGAKIIMPCIIDIYVVINADHIRGRRGWQHSPFLREFMLVM